MIRIGIDVGGTFTDVVTLDEASGATSWVKVPTADEHPADGVLEAIAASRVELSEVSQVRLGTTLGVNAVLTRTGAPTGLITTRGFRDVLEIRRTHRARLFDLEEQPPAPLVPRDLRLEVAERVDVDGAIVTPLDEDGVRAAWRTLRERGVTALAIVFLFSFEDSEHERRAREIVLEEGGAEVVFVSCEVLPIHREYERTSTTAMAAYVAPAIARHLAELAARLREGGLPPGRLSIMTGSGGVHSPSALARNPIPSLLSGPAGGVTGARRLAASVGLRDVLTLDMGGTSCDVSGIVDDQPDERLDADIDGLAVSHPTFDIHTIGAGGGSVAWIDSGGALRVGPRSAGSDPGPACYGLGGEEPTVTDANLVLGRYDPEIPLGGTLSLDPSLAHEAIARHLAEPLGLSVERAAAGVVRIVGALMAGAVRTISLERGRDTRDFTLVAFGGAGPVHGADVAAELGVERILVPPCPGCTSALGAVTADSRHDELYTIARRVWEVSEGVLGAVVEDLGDRAARELAREGFAPADTEFELWLDLRYEGQAHALAVRGTEQGIPVHGRDRGGTEPDGPVSGRDRGGTEPGGHVLARAIADFHASHQRLYGHSFANVTVELVNVRVTGYGRVRSPTPRWTWLESVVNPASRRPVYFEQAGGFVDTRLPRREDIGSEPIAGPAVIHQVDATVLVPPGWQVCAHPTGSLIMSMRDMSFGAHGAHTSRQARA